MPTSPLVARLWVVLAAVLWSAGSCMKVLREATPLGLHTPPLDPIPIAFWRSLFAGLALVPLVRLRGVTVRPVMAGMVACFAVMSGLYLSALGLGPAANAILLQNSAPVWVYLIGVFLLGQKADGRAAVSTALAAVGVGGIVLGNWPWQLSGDGQRTQMLILLMGAGSGLTYGGVVLFLSQLRSHSPAFLMVLNLLGSAAVLGVYLLATGGFTPPTPGQLAFLAVFGVAQMAAPYWLFARGLRTITPQEAGIITLLEPLLNPVWAYAITGEVPTAWTFAGGAVLLVALAWRYLPARAGELVRRTARSLATRTPPMPDAPDAPARWFVRAVTAACCLAAGWVVVKHGTPALPVQDEWEVLGNCVQRDFGDWLVQHHNEHRYPLGRLVWIGTLRGTGFDFRAPMFVSVGLLTAAAVLLQWAARRLRGHAHPLDAIPAVLLLHWGHAFNLYMGYQVAFTLFAYGLAVWVWCGVNWGASGRGRWAWGSAAYATSLVFAGGFGVAVTPLVVGWLGWLAAAGVRKRAWAHAAGFALLAAGVATYSGWVFATMPPANVERLHPLRDLGRWAAASADYLSGSLGYWEPEREGGVVRTATTGLVLLAFAAAAAVAVRWVWEQALGRRTAGLVLLAVLLGTLASALAVGLARPTMSLGGRFTTPSAAGLAAAAVVLSAGVRTRGRVTAGAAVGVAAFAAAVFFQTHLHAKRLGYMFRSSLADMHADLTGGAPPTVLAGRHGGGFGVLVGDYLLDVLPRLKKANVGVFATMTDDPAFAPVPVATTDPTANGKFELTLPPPPPGAFAVRVRLAAGPVVGWQRLTCRWTDPTSGEVGASVAHPHWVGWASSLVFTFTGRPADLTVAGDSATPKVEGVEWLVVSPP